MPSLMPDIDLPILERANSECLGAVLEFDLTLRVMAKSWRLGFFERKASSAEPKLVELGLN
jgi:hypothetical protein